MVKKQRPASEKKSLNVTSKTKLLNEYLGLCSVESVNLTYKK